MLRSFLLRFAMPVLLIVAGATFVSMPLIDMLLNAWFQQDTQARATAIMRSMDRGVTHALVKADTRELGRYLNEVASREHLVAIMVCRADGTTIAATAFAPPGLKCDAAAAHGAVVTRRDIATTGGSVQVSVFKLTPPALADQTVLLVQDSSLMDYRQTSLHGYVRTFVAVSAVIVSLLLVGLAWWAFRRWAHALLSDLRGRRFHDDARTAGTSLPILAQLKDVLREIEDHQRLEMDYQENWTPTALQHVVREYLDSPQLVVVSNREPYVHSFDDDGQPQVHVPASGMVTALEPIVRACAGTWIAHGSGDADRAVVDNHDCIQVPIDEPSYKLRRVWLNAEQEAGYYYGLANEGLWPLCHLAYVRPEFRESDWRHYVAVNEQFAKVVAEETRDGSPLVLIQDYHFAVLPAFVRERRRGATIAHFWHIPWPNAETFGVCPWKADLIAGLLQSDILGFHTRHHCLNFLESVDRYVEGQIDQERMTVTIRDHQCQVAAYPISIEWPPSWEAVTPPVKVCRQAVRDRFGISPAVTLGLGIERWDFTKGILERFDALEHLLQSRPQMRGRISLLQVVSPSRGRLPAYRALQERTIARVAEINDRFGRANWQPIVLVARHQEPAQVFELYRAADFCLVNSLHDGMNLVAKEFVAARDDEDGVLILSAFAGAARELVEALVVNPYDAIETATAMEVALRMPRDERRDRMRMMRQTVKHNNVFRWAGRMLVDAAQIRRRQRLQGRSPLSRTRLLGGGR